MAIALHPSSTAAEVLSPVGPVVVCDLFVALQSTNNPHLLAPAGKYPVTVTLADVSQTLDRNHIQQAYATLRIAKGAA
jgi:hypothetical protein